MMTVGQFDRGAFDYDALVQWDENEWLVQTGRVIHSLRDCLGRPTTFFLIREDTTGQLVERSIRFHRLRAQAREVTVW
jgi:hypothetical protein